MYFDAVADNILKGLGQQNWVLKLNIADSIVRVALTLVLVPRYGFAGFMIMMYLSNIANPVLSIWRMTKVAGSRIDIVEWIAKPVLAAALASLVARLVSVGTAVTAVSVTWQIALLAGIYALCAWLLAAPRTPRRRGAETRSLYRLKQ
jgi:O-antigen/teichoic acid export membrane protein